MRHLLTSFLALHWAVVFALLAFVCIGSAGMQDILASIGTGHHGTGTVRFDGAMVTAPLASAFLIVAALFCWALIETFLGERTDSAEGVFKIAFIAAGGVYLSVLVYGTTQGIGGLFLPSAAQLAALAVSYLVIVGERLMSPHAKGSTALASRGAARVMAKGAAHASLLSRISGRTDSGAQS
ncbi:MAG: hypothetical protein J0I98_11270 [Mesorhizobium sp.]|nr:hypothetical protein [Mesorhizobium sp.]MBN9243364.1 hypothetical protein [Mesorhizobium sp.]